ncbi:MAG: hypothetical protein ACI81R_000299 [Bradymonadia bacterium]
MSDKPQAPKGDWGLLFEARRQAGECARRTGVYSKYPSLGVGVLAWRSGGRVATAPRSVGLSAKTRRHQFILTGIDVDDAQWSTLIPRLEPNMSEAALKRRRGGPKAFDRVHRLEVAMDSYWREGLDSVSLNEICRRAGVSKPRFYRKFGGEDWVMGAVLMHYTEVVFAPSLALCGWRGARFESPSR